MTIGSASSSTAAWGPHVWTRADLANLWVRLTWLKAVGSGCAALLTRTVSVDTLGVKANWSMDTTTITYTDQTQVVTLADRRHPAQQGLLGRHHHQRWQPQQR